MRKEMITSSELKRLIALKANKLSYDDVTEEDFDEITELVFNVASFNGEKTGVDLNWVSLFPNIEKVRIIGFAIDQSTLDVFSEQIRLSNIDFVKCQMEDISFENLNGKLKRVSFSDCGVLDFKYPEVPYITISNSEIDFSNIEFGKVKGIQILNSVIRNGRNLIEFDNIEHITLDGTQVFGEDEKEMEDIEIPNKTKYSHKKTVELVDPER